MRGLSTPSCIGLRPGGAAIRFRAACLEHNMITVLFQLLDYALGIFKWAIIIAAIFSILIAFGVLDGRNRIVWQIGDFLYRFTDPVLRPIRNLLPNFGGIDISPWVAVILIQVIQTEVLWRIYAAIQGSWQQLVF